MAEPKRYDNRLKVRGWAVGGRWGIDRYAYTLHRITGLAILTYFLMHICVTSLRAWGVYLWADEGTKTVLGLPPGFLHQPIFRIGEFLVFSAFAFHAFNGLRLFFVEMGFAVGKPIEPVYPYKTSLGVQRPLFVAMMVLAAVFFAGGAWELFEGMGG